MGCRPPMSGSDVCVKHHCNIAHACLGRSLLLFTMENCFYLLVSQAVRYLRDPAVHPRDKQRMKQELSSELVWMLGWLAERAVWMLPVLSFGVRNSGLGLIYLLLSLQSTLLSSLSRYFRRGAPSSPAAGVLPSPQGKATSLSKASPESQEPLIQLVQAFVRHVQR